METHWFAHQYLGSHELMPSSQFHEWYDVSLPVTPFEDGPGT